MRVAEFFAGIGLIRMALEQNGAQVLWANDIDRGKREMYAQNFGGDDFPVSYTHLTLPTSDLV